MSLYAFACALAARYPLAAGSRPYVVKAVVECRKEDAMKTEGTGKTQKEAAKEAKAEGSSGFAEMCHQMMAGGLPPCCKTQMKDMMAQWMSRSQASEG